MFTREEFLNDLYTCRNLTGFLRKTYKKCRNSSEALTGVAYQLFYTNCVGFFWWMQKNRGQISSKKKGRLPVLYYGGFERFLFAALEVLNESDDTKAMYHITERVLLHNVKELMDKKLTDPGEVFSKITTKNIMDYCKLWINPSPELLGFLVETRDTFNQYFGGDMIISWLCHLAIKAGKNGDCSRNNAIRLWYKTLPHLTRDDYVTMYLQGCWNNDTNTKASVVKYCFVYRLRSLYREFFLDFIENIRNKDFSDRYRSYATYWFVVNYGGWQRETGDSWYQNGTSMIYPKVRSWTKQHTVALMLEDAVCILTDEIIDKVFRYDWFSGAGRTFLEMIAAFGTIKTVKLLKAIDYIQFSESNELMIAGVVRSPALFAARYNSDPAVLKQFLDLPDGMRVLDQTRRVFANTAIGYVKLDILGMAIVYNSGINVMRYIIDNIDDVFQQKSLLWRSREYISNVLFTMSMYPQNRRDFFKRLSIMNSAVLEFDIIEETLVASRDVVFSGDGNKKSYKSCLDKLLRTNPGFMLDDSAYMRIITGTLLVKDAVPFEFILEKTRPEFHWSQIITWMKSNAITFNMNGGKVLANLMHYRPLYLESKEVTAHVFRHIASSNLPMVPYKEMGEAKKSREALLEIFIGLLISKFKFYKDAIDNAIPHACFRLFAYVRGKGDSHIYKALSSELNLLPPKGHMPGGSIYRQTCDEFEKLQRRDDFGCMAILESKS